MTRTLPRPDGRVAYTLHGEGPLIVLVPGMGDTRAQYRHLVPLLVKGGWQVAAMDLRGLGDSDTTFPDCGPVAVGGDVAALLEALDARDAVLVGSSFAAAAVIQASLEQPERVGGLALLGPFAREVPVHPLVALAFHLLLAGPWGRHAWTWWYGKLHVGGRPGDHDAHVAALRAHLGEPGRMAAFRSMARGSKAEVEARFAEVQVPVTVIMGGADPDFPDPRAEAALLAQRLRGEVAMLEGVGHYPHVERPAEVAAHLAALQPRREAACRAQA